MGQQIRAVKHVWVRVLASLQSSVHVACQQRCTHARARINHSTHGHRHRRTRTRTRTHIHGHRHGHRHKQQHWLRHGQHKQNHKHTRKPVFTRTGAHSHVLMLVHDSTLNHNGCLVDKAFVRAYTPTHSCAHTGTHHVQTRTHTHYLEPGGPSRTNFDYLGVGTPSKG